MAAQTLPKPTIGDLRKLNQYIRRWSSEKSVTLHFELFELEKITFALVTDAAWANHKDQRTQAGSMILATNSDLLRGEGTTVIPISWESYHLKRVCSSTLAAEAMSVNAAMGELEFVRMQWYEMTNGGFGIQKWHKNANEICRSNPSAVITDCKSLFDVFEQGRSA